MNAASGLHRSTSRAPQGALFSSPSAAPSEASVLSGVLVALNGIPGAVFVRRNVGVARNAAGRVVRFGLPGMADVHGIVDGRAVEVETKSIKGRQTAAQKAWQATVERAGGVYLLVRSADEAVAGVEKLRTA